MLTEQQINNISKLSHDDLKQILDICIEELGISDIENTMNVLCLSRQRIYQLMNENNTLKLGKHKFLMINVKT